MDRDSCWTSPHIPALNDPPIEPQPIILSRSLSKTLEANGGGGPIAHLIDAAIGQRFARVCRPGAGYHQATVLPW
jgi:hypothetical protein